MELKKIVSIVFVGAGIGLIIYGANYMDTPSSQIGEFFGKTDNKGMISMVLGGILSIVGLVSLFRTNKQ